MFVKRLLMRSELLAEARSLHAQIGIQAVRPAGTVPAPVGDEQEEWRVVPKTSWRYFVSGHGRVWDSFRNALCLQGNGRYPRVTIDGSYMGVHTLMAVCFLPLPDTDDLEVRHLDDDQWNNRVENLAWGTRAQNVADAVRNGRVRSTMGTANARAKLTNEQVIEIRARLARGEKGRSLAQEFGVGEATISRIKNRESYQNAEAA